LIKFLDLAHQYRTIRSEIDDAIQKILDDAAFVGGRAVSDFEDAFGSYQGATHCVGVGNGTDAIEIALEALDLPRGSDIIVPANSFIASSEAVTRSGHRVVFADVDPTTYVLDIADIQCRIRPNTAAIVAVHLYGHPCEMDSLLELATRHGLRVVEDCAQAHGAEYKGRRVGSIGDVGTFSFYPGKNLGAYGDAGAIVTNDDRIAVRCRMIANHGRVEKYNHLIEGRNSRLDGIQAAILTAKLNHLDGWLDRRNVLAQHYIEGLADLEEVTLPHVAPNIRHAFHLFVIRLEQREELRAELSRAGIESGIHYPIALPKLPAYEYLGQADHPFRASELDAQLLSLPLGEHMTKHDVDQVVGTIRHFFGQGNRSR
jgi:dTDP-4-amino-4,6-dideoxygalactose transaminase